MTLPIIHHKQNQIKFGTLFVQRDSRRENPRCNWYYKQVLDRMLSYELTKDLNGSFGGPKLVCFEKRIVSEREAVW
jgi:hypothetical protein